MSTPAEVIASLRRLAPTLSDGELHDAYLAIVAEHTRRGLDVENTDPVFPKWMTVSMRSVLGTIESVCYDRGVALDRGSLSKLGKHKDTLEGFLLVTRSICDRNKVNSPTTDQKYTFADFLRALSTVQVHRTFTYCKIHGKAYPVTFEAYVANMRSIGEYLNHRYPKYVESGIIAFALFGELTL